MDNDQTYNAIAFEYAGPTSDGGIKRQSVARALNKPDVMITRNQDARDSVTDVATKRANLRYEYWNVDSASGKRYRVVASVVLEVPELAVTADLTATLATFRAMMADADLLEDLAHQQL